MFIFRRKPIQHQSSKEMTALSEELYQLKVMMLLANGSVGLTPVWGKQENGLEATRGNRKAFLMRPHFTKGKACWELREKDLSSPLGTSAELTLQEGLRELVEYVTPGRF